MAVDSKTLTTLNAIWKQFATDDPILLNNAATTLNPCDTPGSGAESRLPPPRGLWCSRPLAELRR
jgi:hypothetical protein